MKNFIQIRAILDRYNKYNSEYTYLSDPVKVSNRREYYKNGNIKAYVSDLNIREPYENVRVRNKDYYLYSDNYNHGKKYLELLHMTYKYKINNSFFVSALANYHINNLVNLATIDDILEEKLLTIKNGRTKPGKLQIKHVQKPILYSDKYIYKKIAFENVFNRKNKRTEYLKNLYITDIGEYEDKLVINNDEKFNYFKNKFSYEASKVFQDRKRKETNSEYSSLKQNFISFINEESVHEYLDKVINKNLHLGEFYRDMQFNFDIDLDSRAVLLNLQIPRKKQYPIYKEFKIIKKNLECRETEYTKQDRIYFMNKALNSYILFYILAFEKINYRDTLKKIFINLFYNESLPNKDTLKNYNCVMTLEADLNRAESTKISTIEEIIVEICGREIRYEDFTDNVLPIKKGGM